MKHINKKLSIRGAGKGGPKAQPAVLRPPKLGGFVGVSSYNVAEVIDLISDGPIEGLVDQNGQILNENIFKGVYMDNTPVQNSIKNNIGGVIGEISISNLTNVISNIWMSGDNFKTLQYFPQEALFLEKILSYVSRRTYAPYINTALGLSSDDIKNNNWSFNSDKINIWSSDPFINTPRIISSFETRINQLINNSGNAIEKSIAIKNINALNDLKQKTSKNKHPIGNWDGAVGGVTSSYFIIELSNLQAFSERPINEYLSFYIKELTDRFAYISLFIQPQIANNKFNGKIDGFIFISIPLIGKDVSDTSALYSVPQSLLYALNSSDISLITSDTPYSSDQDTYNFSNISCEFRNGKEFQSSLAGFDKVYTDYAYDKRLLGPFKKELPLQRININNSFKDGINNFSLNVSNSDVLNGREGSSDNRNSSNDFSDWQDRNEKVDYDSLSTTHVIENPLVEQALLTVVIQDLSDTIHLTTSNLTDVGVLDAGSKVPAIVNIQIEIGKITNGEKRQQRSYNYSIIGLVQGMCSIDFGSGEQEAANLLNKVVKFMNNQSQMAAPLVSANDLDPNDAGIARPFDLPSLEDDEDPSMTKRYIKIVKLSSETNSSLVNKDISLGKVTEIINQKLSYPFSAIAGIKLDARAFRSIPERSYDCKLKRIKIPSNYQISDSQTELDIRYVKNAKNYVNLKQIYRGDWDGTFTEGWTDNPAWILYDLLTSKRYGLGAYIDESQINKWELYKIARFCDAVDENGYFIGVSDGVGGLEPRFSCNIMFRDQTKVYDAINIIASLFRGVVFFSGSEIHFLDDRPRTPIALFNNANVKDGIFNYSNTRRDLQFNTVEVVYLDRFDNYKTKVEYIQDEQDIRKRGVFKTTINTNGVTSRAMARRIGQHIIYQTTKENQTVDFSAGLEALLCRPGDLVTIEDEMKSRATNYGKVLEIDLVNKKIKIDNQFISGQYTGFITLYSPTGYSTSSELNQISIINRQRVEQFSITGNFFENNIYSGLKGVYKFSGYTSGFNNSTIYPSQFPAYTGTGSDGQKLFCYYNTGATGFVFATGLAFQDNNTYDKIISNTGVFYGADISPLAVGNSGNYTGFAYESAITNKRGSSNQVSGAINWENKLYPITKGILESEIDTYNISQITKISLTGYDNTVDYGSVISLNQNDPNVSFLAAVKPGSVYRIERTAASDQIYKVISIRENAQNEYGITASRYDTGKFETIEKDITQDFLENTYYTGVITVGNTQVKQLATPTIAAFSGLDQTTNNFKLTGRWVSGESYVTGYSVSISNSLAGYFESTTTNQTGIGFTGLTNIGNWTLSVTALAASPYINSSTATTGTFVAYTGANTTSITKPAVIGFSLQ